MRIPTITVYFIGNICLQQGFWILKKKMLHQSFLVLRLTVYYHKRTVEK